MKTLNKLKVMMMAVVAIVCGMTLYSCGDDDDDDTPKAKVERVELKTNCYLSQDLADIMSVRIDGKSSQTGAMKTSSVSVGSVSKESVLLTATAFPAQFSTTVYLAKKRNAPIKNHYDLSCHLEYRLITYYTDGSVEQTTALDDAMSFEYNTSSTVEGEGSQEVVDQIYESYESALNAWLTYNCQLVQQKYDGRLTVVAKK